jgi:hypothetical protein
MEYRHKKVMVELVGVGMIVLSAANLYSANSHRVGTIGAIRGDVEILHPGEPAFRAAKLYEDVLQKDCIRTGSRAQAKILYDYMTTAV